MRPARASSVLSFLIPEASPMVPATFFVQNGLAGNGFRKRIQSFKMAPQFFMTTQFWKSNNQKTYTNPMDSFSTKMYAANLTMSSVITDIGSDFNKSLTHFTFSNLDEAEIKYVNVTKAVEAIFEAGNFNNSANFTGIV
mmetsp:Transcript_13166/g.20470  ORF Transcript_13166/g.20470 Transcript_13166/m.20470 type:complete len:139 (+) Transcript_13166:1173-1589(+)